MKKYLIIPIILLTFGAQVALADILPPGQKAVPVCAYFTNAADELNNIAVIGYETAPGGDRVDLSRFIADECFRPGYKFNVYSVFGMEANNAGVIDSPTYVPQADSYAYPTNIDLQMGTMYVPTSSTLESVKNAYAIVKIDKAQGKLIVAPVQTEKTYSDKSTPTIVTGEATDVSGRDTALDDGSVFTDVKAGSTYDEALTYLKEQGIVSGYEDGSFKPGNTINRAEFTKIITGAVSDQEDLDNCMANYASQGSYMVRVFKDVTFAMVGGNEPEWFFNYVCVAKLKGLVGGYADGSFKPSQNINFVEAAKIIVTALGYETGITNPWYKTYVEALDLKNAIPLTIKSFNQNITRGEMAEIMYRLKAGVGDKSSANYSDLK
jgi:hypothetical protein